MSTQENEDVVDDAKEAALSSLDQIRQILTGDQERDAKQRFKSIETRLGKEVDSLRADMRGRLSELSAKHAADLAALRKQLAEAQAADEARDDALAERIERLGDELAADFRERHEALRQEANARCDALAAAIAELSTRSVPRGELAGLFHELATRLAPLDQATPGDRSAQEG